MSAKTAGSGKTASLANPFPGVKAMPTTNETRDAEVSRLESKRRNDFITPSYDVSEPSERDLGETSNARDVSRGERFAPTAASCR